MFGYNLNLLPNPHLATLERDVKTIEEARARSGATIGYPGWGIIYHLLLCHLDRKREEILVETGSNQGCTTIILAQALIDAGCAGRVLTFEIDQSNIAIARRNYAAAGVERLIELRPGDVRSTLPPAISSHSEIRFAFLDASHSYDDVIFEFETLAPRLAPDALVLFDNTYRIADAGEDQRVNGAIRRVIERHGGNLINLENVSWFTPGLALWQRQPNI
jgi:predicted O-methyltransferase YrrM